MSELLKHGVNLDNIDDNIKFSNTITKEMCKIDIHEQIMMNIDIITNILYEEFGNEINNNKLLCHQKNGKKKIVNII